jgi:hypothetical protein
MAGFDPCPGSGQRGTKVWRHVTYRVTHWGHCPVCGKGLRVKSLSETEVPRHKRAADDDVWAAAHRL